MGVLTEMRYGVLPDPGCQLDTNFAKDLFACVGCILRRKIQALEERDDDEFWIHRNIGGQHHNIEKRRVAKMTGIISNKVRVKDNICRPCVNHGVGHCSPKVTRCQSFPNTC